MENRYSVSSCEKLHLSKEDKLFIQHALQFYIVCGLFKLPYSKDKITEGVHEFICNNYFTIIPSSQEKTQEELQEHIGNKTAELLKTLSKHVSLDVENMQLDSKQAEEASNALYQCVLEECIECVD